MKCTNIYLWLDDEHEEEVDILADDDDEHEELYIALEKK